MGLFWRLLLRQSVLPSARCWPSRDCAAVAQTRCASKCWATGDAPEARALSGRAVPTYRRRQ
eukprot:12335338-Alexandrium_andersonii.AAC.1